MAQNITLLGASYSDVPAVDLPKTGGGTARFADASVTTAVAEDVASGKVFLLADGSVGTGSASGGGGSEGLYTFGYWYESQNIRCRVSNNHIRIENTGTVTKSGVSAYLHGISMSMPLWFTVPAQSTAVLKYYNITNTDGTKWNANGKAPNSTQSLTWGIGNAVHTEDVIKTRTFSTSEEVGNWFIYMESMPVGAVLELDMSLTVDGVRYI